MPVLKDTINGDFLKYAFVFITGLASALFIYPFLHESGHISALLLFGEEILNVEFFPIPNVECRINDVTNGIKFLAIGLAGETLPFLITLVVRCKGFWLWYLRLSLRLICLISFAISFASVFFYKSAEIFRQDDIVNIMSRFPQYTSLCATVLMCLATVTIFLIIKDIKQFNSEKIYLKF